MNDDEQTDAEDSVREAVDRSRSGAPAAGRVLRDRFSSDEVFQRIVAAADEEITSGSRELFFSGLAAGFAITITFLLYVSLTAKTHGDPILSAMLYPLGFIYIIIGGYQLFTENTLPPVALTLERLASIPALLRNWIVVLSGNFAGGLAGAATLAWGGVLSPEAATAAASIAEKGIQTGWGPLFVKAAFAGLIVAGVVWVEYSARDTISRLVVVYLAFLAIPIGGLFHVVVSFTEMMYLSFTGDVDVLVGLTQFVLPVLAGNTAGGVVLVTVVNYFQTSEKRLQTARFEGAKRQLSSREWLFGSLAGRSYVPLIDTTIPEEETEGPYQILVPVADPDPDAGVVTLAGAIAAHRENAVVTLVHVVPTYDRHSGYRGENGGQLVAESTAELADMRQAVESYGITCNTSTVVTHRTYEEIFDIAQRRNSDLVVMEQADNRLWASGRAERHVSELTSSLPCDFLILDEENFAAERVLLPVVDNQHAELNASVARALRDELQSEVTLLHVVDNPERRERGEQFLGNWSVDNELEEATRIVDDTGDVETAIEREAADHSLVLIGATERGLLSRLVSDSLHYDVITEVDRPVVLAERPTKRSLRKRLFGRQ
ncbi:Formate/nitrite family of transporter [Halanaeroarchaeum sp. HSR-CO]|uniref:formate/nitrite transporter family protein n=1 Tax=Halanaeroarchaeum sp. HSR-CO TaxID=2866382 RepID=UPI00217E5120|nr:formate/nitrite transporter family protein [Halanaeroarchaeum sp. HSR-CO]UWG48700.1 Formate/nitrite family of transporter [Halanaeroarchaeum sp. HSR-CO]